MSKPSNNMPGRLFSNKHTGKDVFSPRERIRLDTDSPVPLYHQLEQVLLKRIKAEKAVGYMLPPEEVLTTIFGVSRATVKRAMDNLVVKGLVERRRALGTRVIRQEITERLARLSSYSEEMADKGLTVRTELLRVWTHIPAKNVREKLLLEDDEKTLCITRLRGTSDVFPVVLLQSEVPVHYGIPASEEFGGSLYRLIEETYRIPIEWAEEEIKASTATAREAKLLGIQQDGGVLVMERLTHTRNDRPLEFVRGVYRPERYKFSIRLKR